MNHQNSTSMNTRLTQEYEIRLPFVGADSESIAMPSLAAALSNAGGIGILGISLMVWAL